jgi:Na+-transporting NADH:ubiquinone oxidoreductase subunit A
MAVHHVNEGLDLRIDGAPEQRVGDGPPVSHVAVVADDYVGLRPRLAVEEGQAVARGDVLFEDRGAPGVRHTAPGAGRIVAVHRGARRALRSVVIELTPGERSGKPDGAPLPSFKKRRPSDLAAAEVRQLLLESGLWTALRTRPFGRVAQPSSAPRALFVNAMGSEPLAPRPEVVIAAAAADFHAGLAMLARMVGDVDGGTQAPDVPTYLCVAEDAAEPAEELPPAVSVQRFAGPHPAGTTGVHVSRLFPVDRDRMVWTIGYQDVIAVGELARTGVLPVERTVALAGPAMQSPRLIRTRLGAAVAELVEGRLAPAGARVVSGSVLSGRAVSDAATAYLGRFHLQVCALAPAVATIQGGPILPLGRYDRVFPFAAPAVLLLRALAAGDLETAEKLGCLDLVEEDVALCSYVCPAGNDYGAMLRAVLERIAAESAEASDGRPG